MKLMTEIDWPEAPDKIDYDSGVLLLGSCFAENISRKFEYFKFRNETNPFGIIYHPAPMRGLLQMARQDETFADYGYVHREECWFNHFTHSCINATSKRALQEKLNDHLQQLRRNLKESTHIVLSFGTAWGYRHLEMDEIVANCLKEAASSFKKELTPVSELQRMIFDCVSVIESMNENAQVILTVSPVRHLRDGMVENKRSKAHLLTAVHHVVEASANTHYFPSYEIVVDELRDYRFYSADLVHPSETAVDHIWDKFSRCWIEPGTLSLQQKIDRIQKDLSHKSFHPESQSHQKFLMNLEKKIEEVRRFLPGVNFSKK